MNKIGYKKTKQENKYKENIKNMCRVIRKKVAANNNDTTYCTEHTYSYLTVNQL